jgi:hypothetical protein
MTDGNRRKKARSAAAHPQAAVNRAFRFVAGIELLDGTLKLQKLKSLLPRSAEYMCYLVHERVIYVGHGNGDRKIGDRIAIENRAGAQVYIIYSIDPRFDKIQASYVEARLIDRLFAAGAPLANEDRPFGSGLQEDAGLEQLVEQSELLFGVAGFRPFELSAAASRGSKALPSTRVLRDVVPVEPEQMPPTPTARYRLHHRGLSAEGFYSGQKTFYIRPGADYAVGEKRGMTAHNKARRKQIEKYLEPVPGADLRMRLRVGLRCLSAPIAAKILSGEHIGRKVWQPIA